MSENECRTGKEQDKDFHWREALDLIESGNIYYPEPYPYGSNIFSGLYTFDFSLTRMRKYVSPVEYYTDYDCIYKSSYRGNKQIFVKTNEDESLDPGQTYYVRMRGVAKGEPLILYDSHWYSFFVREDVYDSLMLFDTYNIPVCSGMKLINTQKKICPFNHGYRIFYTPYSLCSDEEYITLTKDAIGLMHGYGSALFDSPPLYIKETDLNKIKSDFAFCHIFWVDRKEESEDVPIIWPRYFFSLRAIRKMIEIESELVFCPLFMTSGSSFPNDGKVPPISEEEYNRRYHLVKKEYLERYCKLYACPQWQKEWRIWLDMQMP